MNIKQNNDLKIIKDTIQEHIPKLGEFLDCNINIYKYSQDLYKNNIPDLYLKRQVFLKELIKEQCFDLFGNESKKFRLNLDNPVVTNIVDHNGIINHPILLSSHLISSANNLFDSKFDILSLNTALFPFNNTFYNRGLSFNDEVFKFMSKSKSHQLVYYSSVVNFEHFPLKIRNLLEEMDSKNNQIAWVQASRINYQIWPLLFEEKLRPRLPKLITLNQDEIVFKLLEKLIMDEDNFVHDAILNPDFRDIVKTSFLGKTGAWNDNDSKGSFLFWTKDGKNQGVSLRQEGEYLVANKSNFDYKIKLEKNSILEALKSRDIYPGMVILFAALVFHTGLVPLAGYGSINYLNIMKDVWLKILKKDYYQEFEAMEKMEINKLVGGPVLTYRKDENKMIQPAFMLDILMKGGLKEEYLKKIFSMNFNDLLLPAFIDVYNSYIPKEKRQNIKITPDEVIAEQLKKRDLLQYL